VRLHLSGQRQLDAGLVRRVEREVDVLLHERRRERRREVVPHERLGLVLDERGADGRAPHHLEQRRARDVGGLAEHERLGHQLREPGDHQVDRELDDPSLLAVADAVHGRPDREEDGLGAIDVPAFTGDDEGQLAGAHDGRVAAHGGAHVAGGGCFRVFGDPCRRSWRNRAQVDEDGTGPCSREGLRRDRLERVVVRERGEDHVDLRRELRGRGGEGRTASGERLGLLRGSIAHDERVTGIEKALRERRAHVSETDQPHGGTWVLGGTHCPV
jgi:hypothetical protein